MDPDKPTADQQALLLTELRHRVRSTLATTRLIARRSAATSETLDDYVSHLDGRLSALGRVQNAAIHDPLAGIDLGRLLFDELVSAGYRAGEETKVEGPTVLLHPRAAEPFALAFHELTTNAIKFGALSRPEGRLAVSWQVEANGDRRQLLFDWSETGVGLADTQPSRYGFGMVVLREMLAHNLGARTDVAFAPHGMTCRIELPLTERIVILIQEPDDADIE